MSCKKIIIENPECVEINESVEVIEVEAKNVKIKQNDNTQLGWGLLWLVGIFVIFLALKKVRK